MTDKEALDHIRAFVAKHPGGFPEGRLAEIDAALGAQVPSRCTTYDDVTTEEANNGEERARQIIKTMDAFDPLDALSTLYAIQFHLESRLAHIVSYATEAAKTPITREDMHDPLKAQTFYDEAKGFERLVLSETRDGK